MAISPINPVQKKQGGNFLDVVNTATNLGAKVLDAYNSKGKEEKPTPEVSSAPTTAASSELPDTSEKAILDAPTAGLAPASPQSIGMERMRRRFMFT